VRAKAAQRPMKAGVRGAEQAYAQGRVSRRKGALRHARAVDRQAAAAASAGKERRGICAIAIQAGVRGRRRG